MNQVTSICIVDDDDIYTRLLKKTIGKLQLAQQIVTYTNGKEAIDAFISDIAQGIALPDVILLDINMPVWDGWMFLSEFSQMDFSVKLNTDIYIVSSSIALADQQKAGTYSEIKEYLVKPIANEVLMNIAETHKRRVESNKL